MHMYKMVNRGCPLKGYWRTQFYLTVHVPKTSSGWCGPSTFRPGCFENMFEWKLSNLIVIREENPIALFRVGCKCSLMEVHSQLCFALETGEGMATKDLTKKEIQKYFQML